MKRLVLLTVISVAACDPPPVRKAEPVRPGKSAGNDSPPAATAEPDAVPYANLGWDGTRFTLDEKPFTGVTTEYYKNGRLKARYQIADGLNHGLIEEWYDSGRPKTKTNWEHGKHQGDNFYWNPDGSLQVHKVWKDDVLISESHPDKAP